MLIKSHFLFVLFFYIILISTSCHRPRTESIKNIDKAKNLLYVNKIDEAENILINIDTLQLNDHEMALFQTAFGFLYHLTGQKLKASEKLGSASMYFNRYGNKYEKAEVDLLYGFLLEKALLKTEASSNYMKALDYYLEERNTDQYFKAVLGVIRTSPKGSEYLPEAKKYLERNKTNRNVRLFLNTKSYISKDKGEKLALKLEALRFFNEKYDIRKQISLLSNIASNYQALGMADSANYYINNCENIIKEENPRHIRLLNYYLTRAYVNSANKNYNAALDDISIILNHASGQYGIVANAYFQRNYIYSVLGKIKEANKDLNRYVKFLKQEHEESQMQQIVLMSVQMRLKQKELKLSKLKIGWLITTIAFIIIVITGWILFKYYRKRAEDKRRDVEIKYDITSSKLNDQLAKQLTIMKKNAVLNNPGSDKKTERRIQGLQKKEFFMIFNIAHPMFKEKITNAYSNLTQSDLKYCECILAELSVYQTSELLGVTTSAVKKARLKLRSLFKRSTTVDLTLFLKRIDEVPIKIHDNLSKE